MFLFICLFLFFSASISGGMLAFNMAINAYLSVFSRKEARTSKLSITDGIRVITGAVANIGNYRLFLHAGT